MSNGIKNRIVYVLTRKNKADDDTDIYVGSTSKPLGKRFADHKYNARKFIDIGCSKNNRLYVRMNKIGVENWEILPLLARTCDIRTIREVERKWIRILCADLNSYLPIREEETVKEYKAEYYKNNRGTILQKQESYYKKNKGTIREYQASYYEKNKGTIREYQASYYEKNKGTIREYQASYYEKNKGTIREYQASYYENNKKTKRFHCNVCNVTCRDNSDLKKHSYAWLNSVD